MSDESPEQPTVEDGTSEQSPSTSSADLEAVVARALASALDPRMQGIQSVMDRKLSKLERDFNELKTAGLSPEEREQFNQETVNQELEAARERIAMLEARKEHPEAVDFFMEAMSKESFDAQIAFIESRLGKKAAQAVVDAVADEAEAEGTPIPVVDPNNPSRKSVLGPAAAIAAGGEMDDQKADAILASVGKGALANLRKHLPGASGG